MSSPAHGHPSDLDLLRLADGELPAREARQVREHLETCWQCRTELEDLQRTIGECVRYRNQVLHPNLPSPPAPWMDIQAAFSRMDAATGRASFFRRLAGALRGGGVRWMAPALAAAALAVVVYEWRETPSVRAAALLEKSIAAADARPTKLRRIRIQTRTREVTRTVGFRTALKEPNEDLAQLFRAANYNWDDPLSARSFQAWRESLPAKTDSVESGAGVHRIRTATDAGELAAASIKLAAADLRAMESRFEFRNNETVDVSELPDEPAPAQASSNPRTPRRESLPAPLPESAPAPRTWGPADELNVMAALHGVGADLGDPLEISRTPQGIVVSGVGIAPDRQRQIREALRQSPGVEVRFSEPAAAAPASEGAAQSTGAVGGDALRFQSQVERQLGGRALFEDFSGKVLEAGEAAMSRAYALRRLSQRFPAGSESELDAQARATLAGLRRDHLEALARAAAHIEALTASVLTSLGGRPSAVQQKKAGSQTWQAATEDLFQAAQQVERLLAAMLDGSQASAPDLPTRLLGALARLRAETDHSRRTTFQEPDGAGK